MLLLSVSTESLLGSRLQICNISSSRASAVVSPPIGMRSALCSLSGQSVRPATLQHVLALVLHHELRTLSTLPTRSTALPGRPTGLGLPGLPYRQFHTTLHGQDLAKPRALYPERKAAYVLAGFPVSFSFAWSI